MMVPKKSLVFVGAALLCFGSAATAQDKDTPMHRRVTKPLRPVALDLQTGTVTRGPAVQQRGAPGFTTCSTLSNLDHSGFVGVDSGIGTANGPCEWIEVYDNTVGLNGNRKSGYMSSFAFAYCSASLDPISGGTGGKARIGFRAGYVKGSSNNLGGASGTEVGLFNLSGLPAWTGCSSFFGGFACYLINIGFGSIPVCLPAGTIGWSWQFRDIGTDGVLAKTFPFLGCVQSCTGSGPDQMGGMVDTIDQYCPAGSILSTFTFGTSAGGGYFTSISIDLREAEAISVANAPNNGSGVNLRGLAGSLPVLGQNAQLFIDCTFVNPNGGPLIIRFAFVPLPVPIPYKGGEILVALAAGTGQNFISVQGAGVNIFNFPLPKDLSFYGACWNTQAYCGGMPQAAGGEERRITNRITQTMGSN